MQRRQFAGVAFAIGGVLVDYLAYRLLSSVPVVLVVAAAALTVGIGAVLWFSGAKDIGNEEARMKHELEVKEERKKTHRGHLIATYEQMAKSHVSHQLGTTDGLLWHPVYLKIYLNQWPMREDPNYKDAVEDLKCWVEAESAFLDLQKKLDTATEKSSEIEQRISRRIRQFMESYGLEPLMQTQKWYNEWFVIKYLILKRVAEGEGYNIDLGVADSFISVFQNGQSVAALAHGLPDEDSHRLVGDLDDLPSVLDGMAEGEAFFLKLSKDIIQLQEDFGSTDASLELFRSQLVMPIKNLRDGFDPPNGGVCQTCRAIEVGAVSGHPHT